jgi:hypothetical protein
MAYEILGAVIARAATFGASLLAALLLTFLWRGYKVRKHMYQLYKSGHVETSRKTLR